MTGGTSKKEVCLDLGKKNIEALRLLLKEFKSSENLYQIKIIIKKDDEQVELDDVESLFFVNIISAMKLTIQGGAWSEVGKKTEKGLLFTITQKIFLRNVALNFCPSGNITRINRLRSPAVRSVQTLPSAKLRLMRYVRRNR